MWSERPGAWARTAGPGLSVPAKARVLLVGAAAVDQAALDSALAGLDVTIQVTSDEEALQQVEVDDLAAIVLMDGADGLALARRLRSLGSSATPLLFVIDEAAGWPLAEAYALGAVDHVTRPLVPGVVRGKLAFLVEHFQQARRLRSRADGRDEDDARERARAEAELRASEQRLRLATEAAGLGIWVWHLADNRVTWENDRLYEIFGLLRSDEPVDATHFMADFVHPDDAASFERAMAATLKTGAPFYFLGRFRRKDGELRWTELTGQLVAEDDATPVHVLGTAADVTDDKRADDEIRRVAAESAAVAEANAKFRVFFEQGTQFAGVMTLDGTVVEANRLCLEACGYHREEVIGKPFWECGWWNRSPALMERIHEASMQAAQGRLFRTETHYFIADGSQRHLDLILAPVTGEDGRVLFVAPSGTDITDRKRAERALRTSEERLRFLDALAEATRAAADPGDIMAMTTRLLGQHLAVTRTAYADVDADSDRFTIRNDWTVEGAASAAGVYSLDLFGPRAAADMRSGHTLVVCDVDGELEPAEGREMFNAIGVKAIVCCPLVKGERLVAMMAVHHARPRDWLSDEVALVEEVVERSWAHIERVRDAAALREKDQRLKLLVENIKDYAVIICDLEGKVIEWQGGAERITGFTAAEAVGGGAEIIFTAEDRAAGRPEGEMNRAARDGRAEDRRWHVRKDGSRFFADGVMIGLCDEAAQLHGFGKVFKDATGEAIAEESRRRHTEQLRTLADVSNRLNSVLDLARLETDQIGLAPRPVDVAPLVRAAFGQPGAGGHPGHGLRVRLADRSLRQTNPLLDTVAGLLDLAQGRVTANQVLDLAATEPVRRRFGFDDDDLDRLRDWAGRAGVRWGIGEQQRAAYALGAVRQGTWTTGLDRILLGVAADETDLGYLDLALPLDDVDSSDIELAGQLAELVDRLHPPVASRNRHLAALLNVDNDTERHFCAVRPVDALVLH